MYKRQFYALYRCCREWAHNRVIVDTATSRIRSAAQGYVELTGEGLALPARQTNGPLTGKPCAWWRYRIESRGSGNRPNSWEAVDHGISETPFLLDDGTGQCLIDPRGAEVFPNATDIWYGSEEWPDVRLPTGTGFGGWVSAAFATGRYRYTEHRLEQHRPVYAIGSLNTVGGAGAEDPDVAVTQLLREWKQDQTALLARFDMNHDGILSADEWDGARTAARDQVLSSLASKPAAPAMNLLSQPSDGRPFLLAGSDEETLARRVRWRAAGSIALFVCCAAALAWMLAQL